MWHQSPLSTPHLDHPEAGGPTRGTSSAADPKVGGKLTRLELRQKHQRFHTRALPEAQVVLDPARGDIMGVYTYMVNFPNEATYLTIFIGQLSSTAPLALHLIIGRPPGHPKNRST